MEGEVSRAHLVWKVFGVRGGESDPHVGVDAGHVVQQVSEAQPALLAAVQGPEAAAQLGGVRPAVLLLRRVPVAVDVLAQQGYLFHALATPHTHRQTCRHTITD